MTIVVVLILVLLNAVGAIAIQPDLLIIQEDHTVSLQLTHNNSSIIFTIHSIPNEGFLFQQLQSSSTPISYISHTHLPLSITADILYLYFVPKANSSNNVNFTVSADDQVNNITFSQIHIEIEAQNDAPYNTECSFTVLYSESFNIHLNHCIQDIDNPNNELQVLIYTLPQQGNLFVNNIQLTDTPNILDIGVLSLEYQPSIGATGSIYDSFLVNIFDGNTITKTTVFINISIDNRAPIVTDASYTIEETEFLLVVLSNLIDDEDFNFNPWENDGSRYIINELPFSGCLYQYTLSDNGQSIIGEKLISSVSDDYGRIVYVPDKDIQEDVHFTFQAIDSLQISSIDATVFVNIIRNNNSFTCLNGIVSVIEDTNLEFSLISYVSNAESHNLTFTITEIRVVDNHDFRLKDKKSDVEINEGMLPLNLSSSSGTLQFIPSSNVNGIALELVFLAMNTSFSCENASLTIVIEAVNDEPESRDSNISVDGGNAIFINFDLDDTDGHLVYPIIEALPTFGTLYEVDQSTGDYIFSDESKSEIFQTPYQVLGSMVVYVASIYFHGTEFVSFKVIDELGLTSNDQYLINITTNAIQTNESDYLVVIAAKENEIVNITLASRHTVYGTLYYSLSSIPSSGILFQSDYYLDVQSYIESGSTIPDVLSIGDIITSTSESEAQLIFLTNEDFTNSITFTYVITDGINYEVEESVIVIPVGLDTKTVCVNSSHVLSEDDTTLIILKTMTDTVSKVLIQKLPVYGFLYQVTTYGTLGDMISVENTVLSFRKSKALGEYDVHQVVYIVSSDYNENDSFSFVAVDETGSSSSTECFANLEATSKNDPPLGASFQIELYEDDVANICFSSFILDTDNSPTDLQIELLSLPMNSLSFSNNGTNLTVTELMLYNFTLTGCWTYKSTSILEEDHIERLVYRVWDGYNYSDTYSIQFKIKSLDDGSTNMVPIINNASYTIKSGYDRILITFNVSDVDNGPSDISILVKLLPSRYGELYESNFGDPGDLIQENFHNLSANEVSSNTEILFFPADIFCSAEIEAVAYDGTHFSEIGYISIFVSPESDFYVCIDVNEQAEFNLNFNNQECRKLSGIITELPSVGTISHSTSSNDITEAGELLLDSELQLFYMVKVNEVNGSGIISSLEYTLVNCDNTLTSGTVSFAVNSANTSPIARNFSIECYTEEEVELFFSSDYIFDLEGDTLEICFDDLSSGSLYIPSMEVFLFHRSDLFPYSVEPEFSWTYVSRTFFFRPSGNFIGNVTLRYHVKEMKTLEMKESDAVFATIVVKPNSDELVATDLVIPGTSESEITISLLDAIVYSTLDSSYLTAHIISLPKPTSGSIYRLNGSNILNAGENISDSDLNIIYKFTNDVLRSEVSFNVQFTDTAGLSSHIITITMTSFPPVVRNQTIRAQEDSIISFKLNISHEDPASLNVEFTLSEYGGGSLYQYIGSSEDLGIELRNCHIKTCEIIPFKSSIGETEFWLMFRGPDELNSSKDLFLIYTVSDISYSRTGQVSIHVEPSNDKPFAENYAINAVFSFLTVEDIEYVQVELRAFDRDSQSCCMWNLVVPPIKGRLTDSVDGAEIFNEDNRIISGNTHSLAVIDGVNHYSSSLTLFFYHDLKGGGFPYINFTLQVLDGENESSLRNIFVSIEIECSIGTFINNWESGELCKPCPTGGACYESGIYLPSGRQGYWIIDTKFGFLRCIVPTACSYVDPVVAGPGGYYELPGGNSSIQEAVEYLLDSELCKTGYTGLRCGACDSSIAPVSKLGFCTECTSASLSLYVIVALLTVSGIFGMYWVTKKGINMDLSVIAILTCQILSTFHLYGLNWPSSIISVFSSLSFSRFDFDLLELECSFPNITYFDKWFAFTLLFLFNAALYGMIYMVYFVFVSLQKCYIRWANQEINHFEMIETRKRILFELLIKTLVNSAQFFYFPIIFHLARFFDCPVYEASSGEIFYVFRASPSYNCYESEWYQYLPVAIVGIIIYGFGVPMFFFVSLFFLRPRLLYVDDDGKARYGSSRGFLWMPRYSGYEGLRRWNAMYGSLTKAYKPNVYYWELMIILRSSALSMSLIFSSFSASFTALFQALLMIYYSLSHLMQGEIYMNESSDQFSLVTSMSCAILLTSGILVTGDTFTDTLTVYIEYLAILISLLCLCLAIYMSTKSIHSEYVEAKTLQLEEWRRKQARHNPIAIVNEEDDFLDISSDDSDSDSRNSHSEDF